MVEKRFIIAIFVGIVFLILFSILIGKNLISPRVLTPPDKEKLVRYYACMLAICTKGCNHEWLDANNTPDEVALCVERDPITKECRKWCKQICEENGWLSECAQPGECCDQRHNVTVNLEGITQLKGIYDAYRGITICSQGICDTYDMIKFKTEIMDILYKLNRSENFPFGEKDEFPGIVYLNKPAFLYYKYHSDIFGDRWCEVEYFLSEEYGLVLEPEEVPSSLNNERRGLGIIIDE
ncbi:MAG: hypothetical protein QXI58_06055, partial [Candidatus Micrarchaeia archaeon]